MDVKDLQTKLNILDESNEKRQMDIWPAELYKKKIMLFTQIEKIYQNFDVKIDHLAEESIDIFLKVHFMEAYYFVLYQELLILNKFEKSHELLLKSVDSTTDKLRKNEEEIMLSKAKFKEKMGVDALANTNGKIIDMELLFKSNGT